jgi:hypothetical protein
MEKLLECTKLVKKIQILRIRDSLRTGLTSTGYRAQPNMTTARVPITQQNDILLKKALQHLPHTIDLD